jgi:hypothetical protein
VEEVEFELDDARGDLTSWIERVAEVHEPEIVQSLPTSSAPTVPAQGQRGDTSTDALPPNVITFDNADDTWTNGTRRHRLISIVVWVHNAATRRAASRDELHWS